MMMVLLQVFRFRRERGTAAGSGAAAAGCPSVEEKESAFSEDLKTPTVDARPGLFTFCERG